MDSISSAVNEQLATQQLALSHVVEADLELVANPGRTPHQPGQPAPPHNPARVVQQVVGGAMTLFNMPLDLVNTGFAVATNFIADRVPPMPAATLGMLYIGFPHGHLHPPSFTPPVTPVPVPLPSLGPITLGTCIQVLIGGLPAARAGDLGFAVTCCGINPMFEVFLGSSKVFIGGMRAARVADICKACLPSMAGPVRGMAMAMRAAGMVAGAAGAVADAVDAAGSAESDPALAEAQALSASMQAAALAADALTLALTYTMGVDMAVPPSFGAVALGNPTVLIGGFPMINIPNPLEKLLEKIKGRGRRNRAENPEEGHVDPHTCAIGGR
ncbi:PAAR domain-containing protein [Sorangium sp. So ce1335]|uniref:PAAR domain-containing protein n=1 Tax=Sorangium sp. So ce1335 TaxID=3133335 RepID=UPI003F631368